MKALGGALLASEVVGVAVVDTSGVYVRANAAFAVFSRIPAEAHAGRAVHEATPPLAALIREVLDHGTAPPRQMLELGGRTVVIECQPLVDEGLVLLVMDVTGQRAAQRMLDMRLRSSQAISRISAGFIDRPASEMDHAITEALREVGTVLELDSAQLGTFAPDRMTFTHSWTKDDAFAPASVDLGGEAAWWRTEQWADDIAELPPHTQSLMLDRGFTRIAVMPLEVAGTVLGAASFARASGHRPFSDDEIHGLRLCARIFASALDRKRADQRLTERLEFEGVLLGISTRLIEATADMIDEVLAESLRQIREAMGLQRVVIQLLDREQDRGVLIHESCAPGVRSYAQVTLGRKASEFGWPIPELMTGETIVLRRDQLPEHAENVRRIFQRDELGMMALVPLMIGGICEGYIGFHAREPDQCPAEDVLKGMRLLGHIIAGALARKRAEEERAQAFRELQRLKASIEQERDYLREQIQEDWDFREIIGRSESMRRTLEIVDAVAGTQAAVLLRGESGVGKELFARAIHARSERSGGPLVKVNCAAIPRELFESEFFGHVRGAFTGALKDRAGRFELAAGGTLFLDEVGEIPIELQSKLLRVLQESEFERVGDDRTRRADVRLVAATNRNLEADVAAGRLRPDLFYRLNVFPIVIPPLRERVDDIVPLAEHFLAMSCRAMGRPGLMLSDTDRQRLYAYDWPGNVRELQHVIERSVIVSRHGALRLDLGAAQIAPTPSAPRPPIEKPPLTEDELRSLERRNILEALERTQWRITGNGGAAELLGLRPSTLRDRMKALGIRRPS